MAKDSKIRLVLDNWTYADYYQFVNSFQNNNTEDSYRLAQKIIGSWDYEPSLEDADAFLDLGIIESTRIVRTVLDTVQAFATDLEIKGVQVDFENWDTRRFLRFDEARQQMNVQRIEDMMREVVQLPEGMSDPLTFQQGARMMAAILEEYKRLISGKN